MREGKAAARIRHSNVVDVTDVGVEGGLPYLVMELLEGEDLAELLARKGRLVVEDAVDLLLGVVAALGAAHDAGVVHRDLKPQNVFVTALPGGMLEPKVLDFGISKLVGPNDQEALTGSLAVMGTPYYMSPEQARGAKHVDARTDQYAAAVVLYECLTGALPYGDGNMLEVLHLVQLAAIIPPRKMRGDLPLELEAVVLRAMAYDPAARFGSVQDFGAALLPFASEKGHVLWAPVFGAQAAATASLDEMVETVRHAPSMRPSWWTHDRRPWGARLAAAGAAAIAIGTVVAVAAFAMPWADPPRRVAAEPDPAGTVPAARPAAEPPPVPAPGGEPPPALTAPVAASTPAAPVEPPASATPTAPAPTAPAAEPPPSAPATGPAPAATSTEPARPSAAQRARARRRAERRRAQQTTDTSRTPLVREGAHGSIIVH
jgi:serine/threonine-protein kinase